MRLTVLLLGCTICALPFAPVTAHAETPCSDIGWYLPGSDDPVAHDCGGSTCATRYIWTGEDADDPDYWVYARVCVS